MSQTSESNNNHTPEILSANYSSLQGTSAFKIDEETLSCMVCQSWERERKDCVREINAY